MVPLLVLLAGWAQVAAAGAGTPSPSLRGAAQDQVLAENASDAAAAPGLADASGDEALSAQAERSEDQNATLLTFPGPHPGWHGPHPHPGPDWHPGPHPHPAAHHGGFCVGKHEGWFCSGATRVHCCRHDWGFGECGTVVNYHGCAAGGGGAYYGGGGGGGAYYGGGGAGGGGGGGAHGGFCVAKHEGWHCNGFTRVRCCRYDWGFGECGTVANYHGCGFHPGPHPGPHPGWHPGHPHPGHWHHMMSSPAGENATDAADALAEDEVTAPNTTDTIGNQTVPEEPLFP